MVHARLHRTPLRLVGMAVLALVSLAFVGVAAAQPTLSEVTDELAVRDYYVDPDLEMADGEVEDLDQAFADFDRRDVVAVFLDRDDPEGNDVAADQIRQEFSDPLTVLVVSFDQGEVGATSDVYSNAEVGAASDAAFTALTQNRSTGDIVRAFVAELPEADGASSGTPTGDRESDSSSGGGSGAGVLIFLLVLVAVIGAVFFFVKRKAKKVDMTEVERARTEIRSQLDVVATEILEHEDEIELSGNQQAIEYFREANATYTEVSEEAETTTNLLELAELNDEIDEARWQLDAAEALMEGRDVPPKPEPDKPVGCFFDPTHKPGSADATLRTEAGEKEVRVCASCAGKLERGETPEPRMIDVGGRRVPSAKAPRSHGGLGMGGLSIFEVILGGLGAIGSMRGPSRGGNRGGNSRGGGLGLDWGSTRGPRGGGLGGPVFGPQRQPSRGGLPRTPASRPSTRRSGGRVSKGRSSGRARRRR